MRRTDNLPASKLVYGLHKAAQTETNRQDSFKGKVFRPRPVKRISRDLNI